MSDRKHSPFLEKVQKYAKRIGTRRNPPFTAESFLVAVIDLLQSETPAPGTEEYAAGEVLRETFADLERAKRDLLEQVYEKQGEISRAERYMLEQMEMAVQRASNRGRTELTVPELLECILENPNPALRGVLVRNAKPHDWDAALLAELDQLMQGTGEPAQVQETPVTPEEAQEEKQRRGYTAKEKMAALVADVKKIRGRLQNAVFGQDHAIGVFSGGYFQSSLLSMIDPGRTRPRATFLFAGPPGVGKTFLAEQVAQALELPFMRFDMSEYADKEANLEFCGTDKVYKNGKEGNVTGFVAQNPRCVLLFDEIEKAHINVIHLFLQILDAGRLRDNFTDQEVSFTDTTIILTTNAGRQLYEDNENGDFSGVSRKVVMRALQRDANPETGTPYFPGALCSRFASGNVVMFNHIGANHLRSIARKEILRHAGNLEKETGVRLEVEDRVYSALLFAEGGAADARTVRSRAETFFNNELYEFLRIIASDKVPTGIETVETIDLRVDLSRTGQEIRDLFRAPEQPCVLLFASQQTAQTCQMAAPQVRFLATDNQADVVTYLKNNRVDLALLDMRCGMRQSDVRSLNLEDVESDARELFKYLREQCRTLPLYLLETAEAPLSDEEAVSFRGQGVRDLLQLSPELGQRLENIADVLYQQASMAKLARENKVVTFSTAQDVSADGTRGQIRLFDFALSVAMDPEDTKNVCAAASRPDVRFRDVIGAEEAKKELAYFVDYLKNPQKYQGTGVKAPRGLLLYGPPGTGKTMLAKAMACEANVTFLAAEGNQFLRKYVGEGPELVHSLFRTARKYAPAILFIDEIDAIAKERRGGDRGVGEETLTAFLTEMDGFANDPGRPVFVLAATNFQVEPGGEKSLDPALMRRFDNRVYIALPGKDDRIRFLRQKIDKNPALEISPQKIDDIALRAVGMSLADLDSAVELALRSAIREGSTRVTDAILEEAFESFHSGEVKIWEASQLERVARHEAGHAFLCWHSGETPSYLTIVARGDHGGYMQHAEQEGKALFTREELLARIRTSLGGRGAELVYYGREAGVSTGASGDLRNATRLAKQMLCAYGMGQQFGMAVMEPGEVPDAGTAALLRQEINAILQEQMEQAVRILTENRDRLDVLVQALIQNNHLTGRQIDSILSDDAGEVGGM